MKCLVTGAAGFIGNALIKRLVEDGHEVKALIHKTQPKYCEKKVEYVNGDITDVDSIKPLVKNVDVVFHCASPGDNFKYSNPTTGSLRRTVKKA